MTSGSCAMASPSSILPMGRTQTGQSGPARRRISPAVFEISSGSRNSSTNLMPIPRLCAGRGEASIHVLQAVAFDFLHGAVDFAEHAKSVHLVGGILLANLAHGEADMDEDPVAGNGFVILQEAEINPAAHADYFDQSGILVIGGNLDDLSWYG